MQAETSCPAALLTWHTLNVPSSTATATGATASATAGGGSSEEAVRSAIALDMSRRDQFVAATAQVQPWFTMPRSTLTARKPSVAATTVPSALQGLLPASPEVEGCSTPKLASGQRRNAVAAATAAVAHQPPQEAGLVLTRVTPPQEKCPLLRHVAPLTMPRPYCVPPAAKRRVVACTFDEEMRSAPVWRGQDRATDVVDERRG